MALKASALRAAAERVSTPPTTFSRSAGGTSAVDADWEAQQGKTARALMADPDLVMYFAYLVSNRACALAQKVAGELSDLALVVEGWKYTAVTVEQPTRLQRVLGTLDTRSTISPADVSRIAGETSTYIQKQLAPAISKNGRAQIRGAEADSAYAAQRAVLEEDWRAFRRALAATTATRRFTADKVRNIALATPVAAMKTTAGLLDPANLTAFTVQLAAASAACSALGRELDLRTRVRIGQNDFPGGVLATATSTDGVVTSITLSSSPKELGVRSGDTATCAGGSATVSMVDDTTVTFSSSTIVSLDGTLEIASTAYVAWEALVEALDAVEGALPARDGMVKALQSREGDRSAARIRAMMEYVLRLAVILDAPSSEAESALERVGGELYESFDDSFAAQLRAFSPLFGPKTKQAGDKLLQDLEARGFDHAVEMLYAGQVDDLLDARAVQASKVGRVTEIASTLGTYTGGARGVG